MAASMGHQAKLGTAATGAAITEGFEFISEDIKRNEQHVETGGIRGTRSHISENVCEGVYAPGGPLILTPTALDLDIWLPRILGAAESTDVFALAETLPDFVLQIDRIAKVFAWKGCKVNTATFKSSAGRPMTLELAIEALQEGAYATTTFTEGAPGNSGTFPSISLGTTKPFMHHQLVLTIGGTAYAVDNFEVITDNALILDRFNNSQTRTELPEGDRIIKVTAEFPYTSSETALFNITTAGLAATAVWTDGNTSLSMSFVKLQAPGQGPNVGNRTAEIKNRVEFFARKSGSTAELVTTHDSSA